MKKLIGVIKILFLKIDRKSLSILLFKKSTKEKRRSDSEKIFKISRLYDDNYFYGTFWYRNIGTL